MALNIVIAGSTGRMGRELIDALSREEGMRLHAALERPDCPALGEDAGGFAGLRSGVTIGADLDAALAGGHALIDFTRPAATMAHAEACARHGVKMIVGTTGFSDAQRARLEDLARENAMVVAPNMSVGVTVLLRLIDIAARTLGEGYDVEIMEAHHRHKVDAPSGTALRMGEVAARALGRQLSTDAVYGREGVTGERNPRTIGFATVRGGDIVGDHTVLFAGTGERVELTHKASSRATFAQGALRAARFLAGREGGLFDMQDVLGLRDVT
jgi:4-hydroxy-tetrahydrodipicolinate reductase